MRNNNIKDIVNIEYLQRLLDKFSKSAKADAAVYDCAGNMITESSYRFNENEFSSASVKLLDIMAGTHQPAKLDIKFQGTQYNNNEAEELDVTCCGVPILSGGRFLGACVFAHSCADSDIDAVAEMLADSIAKLYDLALANNALTCENKTLSAQRENLFSSLETTKIFSDAANVGIYLADYSTGEIIMWNNTYAKYIGLENKDISGKLCWELLGYKKRCPFCKWDMLLDDNGKILQEYTWENYIGPPYDIWLKITDKALIWEGGRLVHIVTFVDVSEHHVLEEKLNMLAYYERSLNMPNSTCLEKDIKQHLQKNNLLVIDIEGLRKINNVYGRSIGDILMKEMRDYFYFLGIPKDFVYRLDVADFGILLDYSEDEIDTALRLASDISGRCHNVWRIFQNGIEHEIFISVNVCIVPVRDNVNSFFDLINNIEQTLDIARKSSTIAVYNKSTSEFLNNRLRLEFSLNSDVKDNMKGFYLNYQPIVNAGIAMWSGLEVLCRWNSTELGPISPLDFIPMAENNGHMRTIGEWVIEKSITDVKKLGLHNQDRFFLNINLSPIQLSSDNIDKDIVKILEKYDYPPNKLGLEITESNELNFSRHTLKAIERLSEIGVIITLDDFGTGYSSFNTLNKVPAKVLKTSRSFISGMESDTYLQHLFRVMVDLAHVSHMKLVAAGVETKSQALFLLNQGIDMFQGYYFSYPLTIEDVEANIKNFYMPLGELVSMGYPRLDITRLRDIDAGYFLTPKLYKLLTNCMQVIFNAPDGNEAIDKALQLIGEGLDVSRSYVFLLETNGRYTNTNEWCAKNIPAEKHNLQNVAVFSPWLDALINNGIIISSNIIDLHEDIYEFLLLQNIKAILVFPIWRDNQIYGFVGFDDCVSHHNWTVGEVQMLHNLTGIITSALSKIQLQNKITEQGKVLENVLNNMNTFIYVSDLETNKILFANSKLISEYGMPLKGRICWEALQDCSERCAYCPLQYMEKKMGETYQWEFYNKRLHRYFRISDSIIQWSGNKLAHLEYAEDITDIKDYQSMLEEYASTDMFTHTLNRSSFIANAEKLLQKAHESRLLVTMAFADIDGLKKENDTYGHEAGDKLISNVVYSINSSIRDSDIIGRYGGDEFVVSFYNCSHKNAKKRMDEALELLSKISIENVGRQQSFSYGLVVSDEVPYSTDSTYVDSLLNIADSRMFEQKNSKKQ